MFRGCASHIQVAGVTRVIGILRSVVLAGNPGVLLAPACCIFRVCGIRRSTAFLPVSLVYSGTGIHKNQRMPVMDTSTSGSGGKHVRVSLTGMSISGTRDVALSLRKRGVNDIGKHVLASTSVGSRGAFRGPSIMGPTAFSNTGVRGKRLGVSLPTGSVIMLRIG